MKKLVAGHWSLVIIWSLVIGHWSLSKAQLTYPAQYWVVATVNNAVDGTSANGRTAIIHDNRNRGIASGIVSNNLVFINFFASEIRAPGAYFLSAPQTSVSNYGAGPLEFTISGKGWDEITAPLTIAQGQGPTVGDTPGPGVVTQPTTPGAPRVVQEPAPKMKVWFGNRLYQKELVAKGKAFVVAARPTLKVQISIDDPFTLAAATENYRVVIDPGTSAAKTLAIKTENLTQKVAAVGSSAEQERIKSFNLELTPSEDLSEGAHTFSFSSRSSGFLGTASSATELVTVEVMGGPVRVVGTPVTHPSPFSIARDKSVTIQYELSANANIDIYLAGVGGVYIKKFVFDAGQEGGSAGINKITWDGKSDQGFLAGNAVYVGTVFSRDDGRLLTKLKLPVVN